MALVNVVNMVRIVLDADDMTRGSNAAIILRPLAIVTWAMAVGHGWGEMCKWGRHSCNDISCVHFFQGKA